MTITNFNNIEDFLKDESFCNWAKGDRLSDVNFWNQWLIQNPTKREIVNEAKDIILGIQIKNQDLSEEKIEIEWNRLENSIKTLASKRKQKKVFNYKKYSSIAASIVLFISVGFYLLTNNPQKTTYKAAFGEVLHLKLNDGSLVTLNSNSSIHYFGNNSRKIWLTGEAFFEVDKKISTNAKFWVHTNDLTVEVYGTSFNVNTKRNQTAVFLEEGNIWLELKNGKTQKMIPGNYISYTSKDNLILNQNKNMKSSLVTSWKDGSIIFDKTPLSDAIKKIEDTYGLKVNFEDEISKSKIITGTVPVTNLGICLKAIEKSVNVKITRIKNQLFIKNK
jgi:transmembrane sensor